MVTVSTKGRVRGDGTLDLSVKTGLKETDVDVVLILEPHSVKRDDTDVKTGWPAGYFEKTFGSLRDDPIAYQHPPAVEVRRELR